MAQVRLARRAQADLERLYEFLASKEPSAAAGSFRAILEAISVLRQHPLIGRHVGQDLRELVISRGKSGYVALYRYLPARDSVRVLAIKHQREAGFTEH
jgi:plasmid stabilization system protein ParE